jgi:heme/copper-type cytochrome/quinol oxidase subunit 2
MNRIRNQRKVIIATATVLLAAVAMLVPLPFPLPAAQARTIDIRAREFAYQPGTVQVYRGDTVTINLESEDAVHGLMIDGYDVDIQAEPGRSAHATFVANREGTYKFRCTVSCGALHPFMIGELAVVPDWPLDRAIAATLITTIGALLYFWK